MRQWYGDADRRMERINHRFKELEELVLNLQKRVTDLENKNRFEQDIKESLQSGSPEKVYKGK